MKIKFYLAQHTFIPSDTPYQHNEIALAEGFKLLNIEYYANIQHWFDNETQQFLFQKEPEGFIPDICIYSSHYIWYNCHNQFPKLDQHYFNLLIDSFDGLGICGENKEFLAFDLILRCHFVPSLLKFKKFEPWAFGLTNRIINEIEKTKNKLIKPSVYISYRVGQNLRNLSEQMLPILKTKYQINQTITDSINLKTIDELENYDYWNQTGRRHNVQYYELLNTSLISFAFGGILEYKKPKLFYQIKEKIDKSLSIRFSRNFTLIQYDSWRLWESFLSNSCTVHLDLENWGMILPKMPDNLEHYIGVKGLSFDKTAKLINTLNEKEIKNIAQKGSNWVLEHYAPLPTTKRFLNLIQKHHNG